MEELVRLTKQGSRFFARIICEDDLINLREVHPTLENKKPNAFYEEKGKRTGCKISDWVAIRARLYEKDKSRAPSDRNSKQIATRDSETYY